MDGGMGGMVTGGPVGHCYAGEVADPVEVSLGCKAVDYEAGGTDEHCGEEDGEAHFLDRRGVSRGGLG